MNKSIIESIKAHIKEAAGKGNSTNINVPGLYCSELHALSLLVNYIETAARKGVPK